MQVKRRGRQMPPRGEARGEATHAEEVVRHKEVALQGQPREGEVERVREKSRERRRKLIRCGTAGMRRWRGKEGGKVGCCVVILLERLG